MNLTAHIRVVAEMNNIQVVTTPGLEGSAKALQGYGTRLISIGSIDGEKEYLTALHEIGHIVLEHHKFPENATLLKEVQAWKWALEHKRCRLTQEGVDHIRYCLGTYLTGKASYTRNIVTREWLSRLAPDGELAMTGPKGRLP